MKTIRRDDFISAVLEIEGEKPVYKLGGDGSRGKCDCIGLVIGALRRRGGRWSGIHGSNWAARHEVVGLRPANGSMRRGDIVFKARKPSEAGYALPARYGTSKDQRDYYHAGVVYSTSPPGDYPLHGPRGDSRYAEGGLGLVRRAKRRVL